MGSTSPTASSTDPARTRKQVSGPFAPTVRGSSETFPQRMTSKSFMRHSLPTTWPTPATREWHGRQSYQNPSVTSQEQKAIVELAAFVESRPNYRQVSLAYR